MLLLHYELWLYVNASAVRSGCSHMTHWVSHFLKLSQFIPPCVLLFATHNPRLLDTVSPGRQVVGLVWFWPHGERACLVHLSVCRAPHLHAQVFTMRQTEQHHPHSHRRPGCGDGGNGKWTKLDFKCFFLNCRAPWQYHFFTIVAVTCWEQWF